MIDVGIPAFPHSCICAEDISRGMENPMWGVESVIAIIIKERICGREIASGASIAEKEGNCKVVLVRETIQKWVLVMPLYPFHWIQMVQSSPDTIYKATDRNHHLTSEFALEANCALPLLSISLVASSQIAC
jgi:hypothetical protein